MNRYTFTLISGKEKQNGLISVYLVATKNRKKRYLNTGISVEPKNWKDKHKKITSHPLQSEYNSVLQDSLSRANHIVITATTTNKDLELDEFVFLFKKNRTANCFYAYAETELERMKPALKASTFRKYETAIRKLKEFKKEISISSIDNDFLRAFEYYLRTEKGNANNTINKAIKQIKTLLKTAIEKDEIKALSYNVKTTKGNRDYLTKDELNKLEQLSGKLTDKLQNTLESFLFACYTGLRHSDLKALKRRNVSNDSLTLIQEKTGTKVFIPLCKKAIDLIENQPKECEFIFKVYSNQKMNDYLTALGARAGINKNITCHVARHTFATISLNLGIKIETLSDVLGHTDLRTTKIYAKMLEETKRKEFKKWDEQANV